MNSSVSALTTLSPNVQAVALPSATARTALERLPSPLELKARQPLPLELASQVAASRDAIRAILDGDDPRLLVVVGPCSIHDPRSALEYAERLAALSDELDGQLLLVMRAYVEKPRTTVGWKGLAYDPHLDGSDDMAAGLALSRQLMLDMLRLGLPLATELLQPLAAGYFDDLLAGRRSARAPANRRSTASWSAASACRWASRTAPTAASASPATRSVRRPTATAISASTRTVTRR